MNSIYKAAVKGWKGWFRKRDLAVPASANARRRAEQNEAAHLSALLDPVTTIYGSVRSLLADGNQGIVVQLVSATPGEGTSSVARALAKKAATMGHLRVYLMDGNDTGQGSAFAAVKNSKSYVRSDDSADPFANDPAGIADVYAACRKEYQLTIVDCPAISSGGFFETMPKKSDAVIMVVQAEKLRPTVVRQVVQLLEQQGISIAGVVLNKTRRYIPGFLQKFI